MLTIKPTSRFLKDLKLAKKRGQDVDELEDIIDLLQFQKVLPVRNRCKLPEFADTAKENFLAQ